MKFLILLVLLYSSTPTQGLICYLCQPDNAADLRQEVSNRDEKELNEALKGSPLCSEWPDIKMEFECPKTISAACATIEKENGPTLMKTCMYDVEERSRCVTYRGRKMCVCESDLCNYNLSHLSNTNLPDNASDPARKRFRHRSKSRKMYSDSLLIFFLEFIVTLYSTILLNLNADLL